MSWLERFNRRFLLRYRLEYALALLLVYGVRALSPAFAWRQARWVGGVLYRLGMLRRSTVDRNLAVAFPGLSAHERRALAIRSCGHMASVFVDIIFQRRMLGRSNVHERFRPTGWTEQYLRHFGPDGLRRRARGILFLTGHLGNWEVAPGYFGLQGVPVAPVYRRLQNPFADRLVRRIRLESQAEVIEKRGAVAVMLERLRVGENVGFLFDQEAVHGLEVPFFGVPTRIHKTPAALARDHGVRIYFGVMIRRGDFLRYEPQGRLLSFDHMRTGDREADLRAITMDLVGKLVELVQDHPDQYFWLHRRWKRTAAAVPSTVGVNP